MPCLYPWDLTTLGILAAFQFQVCWRTCGGLPQTRQARSPKESLTKDWCNWCITITAPVSHIFDNSKRCVCERVCAWVCARLWCLHWLPWLSLRFKFQLLIGCIPVLSHSPTSCRQFLHFSNTILALKSLLRIYFQAIYKALWKNKTY